MTTIREQTAIVRTRLQNGRVVFFHSPPMWDECVLPVQLEWESVKFGEEHRNSVPVDKFGVYAFMLEPNFLGPPTSAYLLYIGKTVRNFRRRYGEYLDEEQDDFARSKISWMFERWSEHIHFYYASITDKSLVEKTENTLIHTCIPPCNERYKGIVRRALAAFN